MRSTSGQVTLTLALALITLGSAACDDDCDRRQFGDGKKADDVCWAPPSHYCAQGAGDAITEACDPDKGICCTYTNTCIPCDFVDCTQCINQSNPPASCPAACSGAHSSDPEACKQPDPELTICYEE